MEDANNVVIVDIENVEEIVTESSLNVNPAYLDTEVKIEKV